MAELDGYNTSGVSTNIDGIYTLVDHKQPWKYEEDGLTVTRGSAWSGPGCHDGCGVLLYTDKDGKLVRCEGDPENPYNQGRLCLRCINVPEVVNHKDRLLYPLKRDPQYRGDSSKFERISWEEAFDLIYDQFTAIKEQYGAETIAFVQGTGRDIAAYITRLAWSFGSPNYTLFLSGCACYLPRVAGFAATTGSFWLADCSQVWADRYDNPEYKIPEVMVVWGNYPLISNSDGFFGHWVVDLMKRGTKIIMVDPKTTWMSARSSHHLRIRPGCDAALALGFLNIIINEDIYDHDFVERWCYGFDELAEAVKEYTPERVSDITWIPKEEIIAAARDIAAANNATMQWGVAVDMTREALPASQAIAAVFQITGNVDVPGGIIAPPEILNYAGGWGRELLPDEQFDKRIGLSTYPLMRFGFQICHPDMLTDTFVTGDPYKMHGIWLQQVNGISCMSARPMKLLEGLLKLDIVVCVDLFMTPTIVAAADVVLPAQCFPERDGIRVGDGVQRGEVINKVAQVGDCKSDMEINLELGRRFNPEAWPWANVKEMYTSMLEQTGFTFEDLQEKGPAYLPFSYKRYETGRLRGDGQPGFNTPTGRIELWSTFYANAGMEPLPYFTEPEPGPGSTPSLLEEYPYVLTTGARQWFSFHSEHRQVERMRKGHPWPKVYINPKIIKELGLQDGEWVWVENPYGRAKLKVEESLLYDDRVVGCDHGWWFPESDPDQLFDVLDLNINNLNPGIPGKSGFGSNYKTTLIKIYPVKEGEHNDMERGLAKLEDGNRVVKAAVEKG